MRLAVNPESGGEQSSVYSKTTHEHRQKFEGQATGEQVAFLQFAVGETFGHYGLPAPAVRADQPEELHQRLVVGGRSEQRHDDPNDGGDPDADHQLLVVGIAARGGIAEIQRHQKGDDHGGDLAIGIDPPPEPAQNEDQSGAGADLQQDLKAFQGIADQRPGDEDRQGHEYDGRQAPDGHQFFIRRLRLDETPVEVVDDIRRAPVEMGGNGRHEGRHQGGQYQAEQPCRQIAHHGGIGQVVVDDAGIEIGKGGAQGCQIGKNDQGSQGDQYPRPGAQGVVGNIEEERSAHGVLFVLGRKHALHDIAAAARFGPGIPNAPPLHRQRDDEQRDEHIRIVEIGQEIELAADVGVDEQVFQPAHLRQAKHHDRGPDRAGHGQQELKEVGEQHPPQSAQGSIDQGDDGHDDNDLQAAQPEHPADLEGGQDDGGHDEHVEEHSQIKRPETAQEGRFLAAVAQLVELEVGLDARAPPQFGVDEHGEHAR